MCHMLMANLKKADVQPGAPAHVQEYIGSGHVQGLSDAWPSQRTLQVHEHQQAVARLCQVPTPASIDANTLSMMLITRCQTKQDMLGIWQMFQPSFRIADCIYALRLLQEKRFPGRLPTGCRLEAELSERLDPVPRRDLLHPNASEPLLVRTSPSIISIPEVLIGCFVGSIFVAVLRFHHGASIADKGTLLVM